MLLLLNWRKGLRSQAPGFIRLSHHRRDGRRHLIKCYTKAIVDEVASNLQRHDLIGRVPVFRYRRRLGNTFWIILAHWPDILGAMLTVARAATMLHGLLRTMLDLRNVSL